MLPAAHLSCAWPAARPPLLPLRRRRRPFPPPPPPSLPSAERTSPAGAWPAARPPLPPQQAPPCPCSGCCRAPLGRRRPSHGRPGPTDAFLHQPPTCLCYCCCQPGRWSHHRGCCRCCGCHQHRRSWPAAPYRRRSGRRRAGRCGSRGHPHRHCCRAAGRATDALRRHAGCCSGAAGAPGHRCRRPCSWRGATVAPGRRQRRPCSRPGATVAPGRRRRARVLLRPGVP